MSFGPNASLSTPNSYFTSLRTSPLTTSLHSKIHNHLTTRDRGATHKLKPRSFIKLYSALISFTCHWSLLLGFILLLSNIPLRCSTLLHSGVYFYLLLCTSILWNSVLDKMTICDRYYSGYQLICLILIVLRHDWHQSKGLFKGFPYPLRLWESSKNWWRYGQMKFVIFLLSLFSLLLATLVLPTFRPHCLFLLPLPSLVFYLDYLLFLFYFLEHTLV